MNFGGNKIKKILKKEIKNRHILANKKLYYYEFINKKNEIYNYKLKDASIFIYDSKKSYITYRDKKILLKKNTLINISNEKFALNISEAKIFIAGTKKNVSNIKKFTVVKKSKIYKVSKPWGYELWFTGKDNKNFSFKKIFLKSGFKTSLQYHNKKEETNFLFSGEIFIHYSSISLNNKKNLNIETTKTKLTPFSIIDIKPKIVHRVESITSTELYEVSTPYLDDVIRLADDSNRKDGKILSEHKKK